MLIDLSKLLTHEGKQQQVEILPSGDTFSCELGEFSYGEKKPVKLDDQAQGESDSEYQCERSGCCMDSMFQMSGAGVGIVSGRLR